MVKVEPGLLGYGLVSSQDVVILNIILINIMEEEELVFVRSGLISKLS